MNGASSGDFGIAACILSVLDGLDQLCLSAVDLRRFENRFGGIGGAALLMPLLLTL